MLINSVFKKKANKKSAIYTELKKAKKSKKVKRITNAVLEKEVQSQETNKESNIDTEATEQLCSSK